MERIAFHAFKVLFDAHALFDHARRRAGHERRASLPELPGVDRVESVYVLLGQHPVQHAVLIHALRERKLDEDPVDGVIRVERVDQREQLGLGGVRRQRDLALHHAKLGGPLALVSDVDRAGGIVADKHHREARRATQSSDARSQRLGGLAREGFSVEDVCAHEVLDPVDGVLELLAGAAAGVLAVGAEDGTATLVLDELLSEADALLSPPDFSP